MRGNYALGWASTVTYFLMNYIENILGMLLALLMAFYSIRKMHIEYIHVRNQERREQEDHERKKLNNN